MGKQVKSGVRLQVRADRPNGVIRAFFAADDGSFRVEVSQLDIRLADDDRQTFDDWVAALSGAINRFVARTVGIAPEEVTSITEKLCDRN